MCVGRTLQHLPQTVDVRGRVGRERRRRRRSGRARDEVLREERAQIELRLAHRDTIVRQHLRRRGVRLRIGERLPVGIDAG
jgi:hypothetical protein